MTTINSKINQLCARIDAMPVGHETRVLNRFIATLRYMAVQHPGHDGAKWAIAQLEAAVASLEAK